LENLKAVGDRLDCGHEILVKHGRCNCKQKET
jgi:hypothetical protein